MGKNGEEKNVMRKERILDLLCLAASYGILFLLPPKTGVFFYIIFGVSAFLFCIGFFRLGLSFDKPSGPKAELAAGLTYTVIGALINTAGLYIISQDHGSARSIMVATLLLIEALVMFAIAGSGSETAENRRLISNVFGAAAVLLILFGIAFVIWNHFTDTSVIIATILLIESICLWKMRRGGNPFNELNPEIQTVPGLRIPAARLQQTFSGVKTQLGYPWIGKMKTIKQDTIIYGPSEDGFAVYGYYLSGRFYIAGSSDPAFQNPEEAKKHITAEISDSNGVLLNKEELVEAYAQMFARYAENGSTQWISDH